jgi:hypothetical protein
MPYIVRPKRWHAALATVFAALFVSVTPAFASGSSSCEAQPLSQPFLAESVTNYFVLAPGETANNFEGRGWTLTGGARIVQTRLSNGGTGSVLEIPSGSTVVSPTFCVTTEYPTARALVSNASGAPTVDFEVSYEGSPSWRAPKSTSQLHAYGFGWGLTEPLEMQPEPIAGWQHVRITLLPARGYGSLLLYDLYIDPYTR